MIILAGMVKATLQIISIFIWLADRLKACMIVVLNGAMLNQATKVRKNASQVMCKVLHCCLLKPSMMLIVWWLVEGPAWN